MAVTCNRTTSGLVLAPGRLHAQPGEVLHDVKRHGDETLFLVYRSARRVRVFRTVPTSTGTQRKLCTKWQITERMAIGKPRMIGDEGDFEWRFVDGFKQKLPIV